MLETCGSEEMREILVGSFMHLLGGRDLVCVENVLPISCSRA